MCSTVAPRSCRSPADASVDAATVGQAFHWFDAEAALRQLGRVIRPGGALALVWNVRDTSDPAQHRIQQLLRAVRGSAPSEDERPWRAHADASPLFGDAEERTFPWETAYTRAQYAERLSSVSFVAALPAAERTRLLERVGEALAGEPDPLPFRYRTQLFVFPRVEDCRSQKDANLSQSRHRHVTGSTVSSVVEGGGCGPTH